jgi:hypothetical protein
MTFVHEPKDIGLARRVLKIYRELRCDCGGYKPPRLVALATAWKQARTAQATWNS